MVDSSEKRTSRRVFVGGIATGAAAMAIGCGTAAIEEDGAVPDSGRRDVGSASDTSSGDGPVENQAPVWLTVPTVRFTHGVPSAVPIGDYVTDPNGDALMLTINELPLPEGVTFEAGAMSFLYDGSGPVTTTSGHTLTADDGRG